MEELFLKEIYIYPIKSLGGIQLAQAEVQATGLKYDRRWMLVDEQGKFLSQRTFAQMALLQVNIQEDVLVITHKEGLLAPLKIDVNATTGTKKMVSIWDDVCEAVEVCTMANEWFSHALNMPATLVFMPSSTERKVDADYAHNNEIVSFADAYPLMMIGQSSLDDLNQRLTESILMNRFRPNLVFSGGNPYCEDTFASFTIGEVAFKAVKPCYRCVLTTINQETGFKGNEPLRTLATYRTHHNKIMFGQNLLQIKTGIIKIDDQLQIQSLRQSPLQVLD